MNQKILEQCAREAANACEEWYYTPQAQNAERNEAVEAFMEIITKHFREFAGDGLREAAQQMFERLKIVYGSDIEPGSTMERWEKALAHAPENSDTKRIDWLESQNNEPDFDWYVQELDSGKLMPHPLRKGTEWGTHYPTLRAAIDAAMRQSAERE